jgi:hypothetical protein
MEVVQQYCEYHLWLKRLAYDTALANHLLFIVRKSKANLSSKERRVMLNMLSVAQKSVADDMTVVAKIGIQSRQLTSSRYFKELQGILGVESVSELRRAFGGKVPKELQSWMWKIFRRRERRMLEQIEESYLRLLYWRRIFEECFYEK